jgi:hypothetical protein
MVIKMSILTNDVINFIFLIPIFVSFFFSLFYARYYEDKLRSYINNSNWKDVTQIPKTFDQDFFEGSIGDEDGIIKKYKKKVLFGRKISLVFVIISILMVVLMIPLHLNLL